MEFENIFGIFKVWILVMVYSPSKVWQIVLGCNSACKMGNYCGVKLCSDLLGMFALVNGVLK